MNFLKKWLYKQIKNAWESEQQKTVDIFDDIPVGRRHNLNGNYINFKIYKASGGYVVETTNDEDYGNKPMLRGANAHTSNPYALYLITSDQDLAKELSKILVLQSLKN